MASITSASALYTDEGLPRDRPAVVGHRGAAGLEPPNTLAAIRRAIDLGVDGVELDVRRTRDGELVLFHDPVLDWATDGDGQIHETTWDELSGVRIDGEPIPRLDEALSVLAGSDVDVYLELKRVGYAHAVLDAVERRGVLDRLTVVSLKRDALDPVQDTGIPTGLVGTVPNPELIDDAIDVDADLVLSHYVPRAVSWFIDEAQDRGLQAGVWGLVDTKQSVRDAIEADLDVIATNRPDFALEVLRDT